MRTATRLLWIGAGYALALAGGVAAVVVNNLRASEEIAQTSGGMAAFGDMILFVLVSAFLSLVPTWFLLKLSVEKAPRAVLAIVLLMAITGPASWLLTTSLAGGPRSPDLPQPATELLGVLLVFGAIPRLIAGPAVIVIEATTLFLLNRPLTRALLVAALLMDIVPLSLFALHIARATH